MNKITSLDNVLCFVEVARRKGFTAAAAALDIPSATLSRRVSELEKSLGSPLLTRTTRRVALTPLGEQFFNACQESIETLLGAEERLKSYLKVPAGQLRVSFPEGITVVLPSVMAQLQKQYPQMTYYFELGRQDNNLRPFDVIIRAGRQKDSQLIQRRLVDVPRILVASTRYLDSVGRPKSPDDLIGLQRVGWNPEDVFLLRRGKAVRKVPVSSVVSGSNSILLGIELAASGAGIAWVPYHHGMRRKVEQMTLERVLPEWDLSPITVYALFESRVISARAQAFLDVLVEHLKMPY